MVQFYGEISNLRALLKRKPVVAFAALIFATFATTFSASAQHPTFPLLQEGGPRTAFVSGAYGSCFEKQKGVSANSSLSDATLGSFCLCYARAIADALNGSEYEAIGLGRTPPTLTEKAQVATKICMAQINPAAHRSEREKDLLAQENQCLEEYHPKDTDYSALIVRKRFCSCYSAEVTKFNKQPRSATEAVRYCSQRLGEQPKK
jgi:hypothetical protein